MPDKKHNCLNIQLSRGHPIKFLEFASLFIKSLKAYVGKNLDFTNQNAILNAKSQFRENRTFSYNSNPNTFIQMPTQSLNLLNNNSNFYYMNGSRLI